MERAGIPFPAGHGSLAREHATKSELVLGGRTLIRTVNWARVHTRTILRGWHMDKVTATIAELLVSELVTHAVTGGDPQPVLSLRPRPVDTPQIMLTLRYMPRHLMIEVSELDPVPPARRAAAGDVRAGPGLVLVDALSTFWNHSRRPSGSTTVFCVVELVPSAVRLGQVQRQPSQAGHD